MVDPVREMALCGVVINSRRVSAAEVAAGCAGRGCRALNERTWRDAGAVPMRPVTTSGPGAIPKSCALVVAVPVIIAWVLSETLEVTLRFQIRTPRPS